MAWLRTPIPCTLSGIALIVEDISDDHARTVVANTYPHRDGASLEDMGSEPDRFSVTGYVHGAAWLDDLAALKAAVASPMAQTFTHPQWGTKTGKVTRLSVTHRSDEHNVGRIRLDFVVGDVQATIFSDFSDIFAAARGVELAADAVASALAVLP